MKNKKKFFLHGVKVVFDFFLFPLKKLLVLFCVFYANQNWRLSKKGNLYSPLFKTTIFKSGDRWKLAQQGVYFGDFETAQLAQSYVLQNWLAGKKLRYCPKESQKAQDFLVSFGRNNASTIWENDEKYVPNMYLREADENLKANLFYLASTFRTCFKCQASTPIYAIVLPQGFEALDDYAIEDLEGAGFVVDAYVPFSKQDYLSIVCYVTYISPAALRKIHTYTGERSFCKAYSLTTQSAYYRSICNFCGAAQGDNFTISEYNTPFCPDNLEGYRKIHFQTIFAEISLRANTYSIGYPFMEDGYLDNVA